MYISIRYLVAYDGDVASSWEDPITHVVVTSWDVDHWAEATRKAVELHRGQLCMREVWVSRDRETERERERERERVEKRCD